MLQKLTETYCDRRTKKVQQTEEKGKHAQIPFSDKVTIRQKIRLNFPPTPELLKIEQT